MKTKIVIATYFLLFTSILLTSIANAAPAPQKQQVTEVNQRSAELNEKGVAAIQKKDFKYAESLLRDAVSADPNNATAVYNLAGAYVTNQKDDQAIHLLEDFIQHHDGDAGIFARLGDAYFSNKNIAQAAKNYEKASKLDPGYPKLAKKMGAVYGMLNRMSDSEKMYLRAVKEDATDSESLSNLAAIYLVNRKPEDSIRAAKNALQQKVDGGTYVTLGSAYEMLSDFPNAVIAFEKALALESTPNKDDIRSKVKELKARS